MPRIARAVRQPTLALVVQDSGLEFDGKELTYEDALLIERALIRHADHLKALLGPEYSAQRRRISGLLLTLNDAISKYLTKMSLYERQLKAGKYVKRVAVEDTIRETERLQRGD